MAEPQRVGLISVVGGESTGKSVLAAELGVRLPAVVVPESLRCWVDQHGRVPQRNEQADVMAEHRDSEIAALFQAGRTGVPWVVSDSGPLMTAVYSVQYYGDDSLLPRALTSTMRSDLVVWCQDDFPWQPDPQRDGSDARARSQEILAAIFADHPAIPLLTVGGTAGERVEAILSRLHLVA